MSDKNQEIIKVVPDEFQTNLAYNFMYPIRDWEISGYKQRGQGLTEEGHKLIEEAIGATLNIRRIKRFLTHIIRISKDEVLNFGWPDIEEECRYYLLNKKAENPTTGKVQKKNSNEKKRVNARMLEHIAKDKSCHGWTCTQWAKFLTCSKPSVTTTKAWKDLWKIREGQKAEKDMKRSRR
jgi:hypothetical protein